MLFRACVDKQPEVWTDAWPGFHRQQQRLSSGNSKICCTNLGLALALFQAITVRWSETAKRKLSTHLQQTHTGLQGVNSAPRLHRLAWAIYNNGHPVTCPQSPAEPLQFNHSAACCYFSPPSPPCRYADIFPTSESWAMITFPIIFS